MPITWATAVVGSLAVAGIPPFAGFFSKDAIIEAVHLSKIPGHGYAYFAVMAGVFITAFYSFRMLFLAFHGKPRWTEPAHDAGEAEHGHDASHGSGHEPDAHHGVDADHPPKESPWVVTVPLVLLAIPSVYTGWTYIEPMLFGGYFGDSLVVRPEHAVLWELKNEWQPVGALQPRARPGRGLRHHPRRPLPHRRPRTPRPAARGASPRTVPSPAACSPSSDVGRLSTEGAERV